MDRFAAVVGRQYRLYEYYGPPDAERVLVIMGSGAETVQETVDWLNAHGEKIGMVKVRLFRPFAVEAFVQAFPASVRSVAVLDRTKEPGASRRAPLPGRGHRVRRVPGHGHRSLYADAHDDRRPLRPLLEGVHARLW